MKHLFSKYLDRVAVIDSGGEYTYEELVLGSESVAASLLKNNSDLCEKRVAMLIPSSFEYAAHLLGIWIAGGIAVPLCITHPLPEIEYVLNDAGVEKLVCHPTLEKLISPIMAKTGIHVIKTSEIETGRTSGLPEVDKNRRAMIIYTSGTTGKPKGVVHTHESIEAQIGSLLKAWEWRLSDRILHILPLHHVHGIVNILLCALWSGATCEMWPEFDAGNVWRRFISGDLTLFMAVPTIYSKLIAAWEAASKEQQQQMSHACKRLRLMVSGSAALSTEAYYRWKAITGHRLLERYGMTEIGMALSNPLSGDRRPGFVGVPLPGVKTRLIDEDGNTVDKEGSSGELLIKGQAVFKEYWKKPQETKSSFNDGWFMTGDIACVENGYYRILGRRSIDIIKTGGYKVSALEIEEALRRHPAIEECAVVGTEDPTWGERVSAAVMLWEGKSLSFEEMRRWAKGEIAGYKVPTKYRIVGQLPRNAMGKVVKPKVKKLFS